MADEFQSDQDFALGAEDSESEGADKLYGLRHSTSHIMAYAVQQIFPEVKFSIAPRSEWVFRPLSGSSPPA